MFQVLMFVWLQEFEDVFPIKILSGLPPIKGIEYQIDLVPSLVIPNRPAYVKSNYKEKMNFKDKWTS